MTSSRQTGGTGKVWFVGAGPGDPELLTLKAARLLRKADAVLYAGSLVGRACLEHVTSACEVADSKGMTLEEITAWLIERAARHEIVVRLQTGDPSLYGALIEMARPLERAGIEVGVVPGVSSAFASAAAACESLTLPEVTQTVILTRVEGRTPMPDGERLRDLARHKTTICLFLSITLLAKVREELLAAGWREEDPVLVVHKASWPGEEKIVRGTIGNIRERCRAEKIASQAMIVVGPTLGARRWPELKRSKLYDPGFTHRFRKAAGEGG
ncbi:MAG: precorrin-4 C(11)-methyltransferase [Zetaproteobacteria bacterium]|nr:MAG: precorrin-4 C(11)-methyltransferase [Zetaproteobacteria bacterium]